MKAPLQYSRKAMALMRAAASASAAGLHSEAESAYREWSALEPEHPGANYGLALLLLARGQFEEGWPLYEARTQIPETGIVKPRVSSPEWGGEPIESLLVFPEQGLGDQIMFYRWIPEVASRGTKVTLLTPRPLVALFRNMGANVLPAEGSIEVPRHDAWCLIGSLPMLAKGFPTAPYVPPAGSGPSIGVMTSGNPKHVNDANRSLPPRYADELRRIGTDLHPTSTGAGDFLDTHDIIGTTRHIVSVDTSVAHLAGAMGKKTTLLLPYRADWRWGYGKTTIWYPSVTILRQTAQGNWDSVFNQLRYDDL